MVVNSSNALYVVDAQASVWKSTDSGVSWTQTSSDYNGANGNTRTADMAINSSGALFILDTQDLWQSINSGVTWTLANDDVNGAGDSNSGVFMTIDANNYIYIADGSEDIYKSTNSGSSFTQVIANLNGASGGIYGLTSFRSYTNLTFQVKNCSQADCSDGTWNNDNKNLINKTSRYLQYKFYFSTPDSSSSPKLYNVSLDYNYLDNIAPVFSNYLENPLNNSVYSPGENYKFNVTAYDLNLQKVWIEFNGVNYTNGNIQNISNVYSFTKANLAAGTYSYKWWANDSYGNLNNSGVRYYTLNKASGDIRLYLNGNENNLTVDYPQQYNATATTLYGTLTLYKDSLDITSDNSKNITPSRNAGFYNITAVSSGDENHSSLTITRWLNVTLDVTAPNLTIILPGEGNTYGYNTSLSLNYSASDEHLASCWYNLNNGANISLLACANTTFDLGADGTYTLYLYANDSLGNLATKSSTFSLLVGAPTITLVSPVNNYLNSKNVIFKYIPSDLDLRSCELWGNFTGEFKLNQTDNNPLNGLENTFSLDLNDGNYLWDIRCNDSMGNFAFNGNKTFYVDTLAPTINLTSPIGKKTSRTNILLNFSVSDNSAITCYYNLTTSIGTEVLGNTNLADCLSTSFNVSTDGDYIVYLTAIDSAGNTNMSLSSFSVDTTIITPPSNGGGGGGGGGGSSTIPVVNTTQAVRDILKITPIEAIVYPKEEKLLGLTVKNDGLKFVNKCKVKTTESQSSWISSSEIKNIAPGEIADFSFTLTLPADAGQPSLYLECLEGNIAIPLKVILVKPNINVEILQITQQENDQLLIKYTAEPESDLTTDLIFSVYLGEQKIVEQTKNIKLIKGQKISDEITLKLKNPPAGLLKISIRNNGEDKPLVEDSILYGKSKITGFSLFGADIFSGNNLYLYLLGFIIVLATGVFAIAIIRKIIVHVKTKI